MGGATDDAAPPAPVVGITTRRVKSDSVSLGVVTNV